MQICIVTVDTSVPEKEPRKTKGEQVVADRIVSSPGTLEVKLDLADLTVNPTRQNSH